MKKTTTPKTQKKILVSVWTLLISRLNGLVESSFLRRDAFLDYVLRSEANHIETEIPEPGNSDLARSYLDQQIRTLDLTPVSLNLSEETIEAINSACKARNIPRDCFINRTLFLLSGGRDIWLKLVPDIDWDYYFSECRNEFASEVAADQHWGVLQAISSCLKDEPFWWIRMALELARSEEKTDDLYIHQVVIPANFLQSPKGKNWEFKGLNCYLPDHQVDGSAAWVALKDKQKVEADEFLKLLEEL